MIVLFICSLIFVDNNSFGYHNDVLTWKLIAVSTFKECNDNQWQIIHDYLFVIKEYLGYYKIDNRLNPPSCVSVDNLEKTLTIGNASNDLIIIMPDHLESLKQQIKLNEYGHFTSYDNGDNVIVSQVLVKNQVDEQTVWVLSHELSHFALHWYGYPKNIVRDKVHEIDFLHSLCLTETSGTICPKLITYIDLPTMKTQIPVMSPIYVDFYNSAFVGNKPDFAKEKINEELKNKAKLWSDNQISDHNFVTSVMSLTKDVHMLQSNFANGSSHEVILPHWIKKNAKWWSDNKISTNDFFYCLQFLIKEKIIRYE